MCSLKTLKKYEKPVKNLKKTIATLYNTIIIPHEKLNAYNNFNVFLSQKLF